MKLINYLFPILLITSSLKADFRVSHYKFMDRPKDNLLHLGTGLLSQGIQYTTKTEWWKADLTAIGLGVVWEVKDAYVPWEKYGKLGGDGFSWVDIRTNIAGVVATRLLNHGIKKSYNYFKRKRIKSK